MQVESQRGRWDVYLDISEPRHEIWIFSHQSVEVKEEIIRPALQLLHNPSNLAQKKINGGRVKNIIVDIN